MKLVQTIPQSATQTAPFAQGSQGWGMWCRFSLHKGAKGAVVPTAFPQGSHEMEGGGSFLHKGGQARGVLPRFFAFCGLYQNIHKKFLHFFVAKG